VADNRPLIIGADYGNSYGFAVLDGVECLDSGVFKLKAGAWAKLSWGRWWLLRRYLTQLVTETREKHPKREIVCAFEGVKRHTSTASAHVWGGMHAHTELVMGDLDVPLIEVNVGVWKKLVCGAGNASKTEYTEIIGSRYAREMPDDEAAAIGIGLGVYYRDYWEKDAISSVD